MTDEPNNHGHGGFMGRMAHRQILLILGFPGRICPWRTIVWARGVDQVEGRENGALRNGVHLMSYGNLPATSGRTWVERCECNRCGYVNRTTWPWGTGGHHASRTCDRCGTTIPRTGRIKAEPNPFAHAIATMGAAGGPRAAGIIIK